jgi:hypothetical protein
MEIVSSNKELSERERFQQLYKECPIPADEKMYNQFLFISRQNMMRFLFIQELYLKAIPVHGVVAEFGSKWGQNLAIFTNLRGIYEPYNYLRYILSFDTFDNGFPSVDVKDGAHEAGEMAVAKDYDVYLDKILKYHESENPIPQIKKYRLIKGDACVNVSQYMTDHPETIISLAYMDYDIYSPTKITLEAIKEHLTKGSIVGFDQAGHPDWKGEGLALFESIGLRNIKLQHSQFSPTASYFVVE